MTTSPATLAPEAPASTNPSAWDVLAYEAERFGYLRCVPCATAAGRTETDKPVTLFHLFDGEEACTDCGEPLVPDALR